jgi:glycosyltransferase involved in cell wall biosynthesis
MPIVSIIVPCYNSYKHMERCLKALENQTCKDIEIIFVDDCSTDNTYDKLIEYKSTSSLLVQVIKNETNSGPGKSRSNGIDAANGEWVAFCDSDDWYENDFVEVMLDNAFSHNADIVMCDLNYAYKNDLIKKCGKMDSFSDKTTQSEFIAYAVDSLCTLLVKRILFDNINMPLLYNGEDVATVPQLLAQTDRIAFEKKALYNYFMRPTSASCVPSERICRGLNEAFNIIEKSIGADFTQECEYKGILIVLYGVTLNALKVGAKNDEIHSIARDFKAKYPLWHKNQYIKNLGKAKKIYLFALRVGFVEYNRLFAKLHMLYVKQ